MTVVWYEGFTFEPVIAAKLFLTIPKQTWMVFVLTYKCFQSNDIESVWNELKLIIYDAMHLYIPKIKINPSRILNGLLLLLDIV